MRGSNLDSGHDLRAQLPRDSVTASLPTRPFSLPSPRGLSSCSVTSSSTASSSRLPDLEAVAPYEGVRRERAMTVRRDVGRRIPSGCRGPPSRTLMWGTIRACDLPFSRVYLVGLAYSCLSKTNETQLPSRSNRCQTSPDTERDRAACMTFPCAPDAQTRQTVPEIDASA